MRVTNDNSARRSVYDMFDSAMFTETRLSTVLSQYTTSFLLSFRFFKNEEFADKFNVNY